MYNGVYIHKTIAIDAYRDLYRGLLRVLTKDINISQKT